MEDRHMNDRNNNNDFICGVVEGFYGKPWTCEQRKDLFKKLKEFKMNAFMYAPKDDTKHRAKWRQLYLESEANDLKALISEAKSNGIDFFYSLAPGLDMTYSDREDLDLLVKKYDQLVALGCECFAILFDDIEPSIINDKDKEVFRSYVSAQVSVTNMIFEHLNRPKFLFCPTEYCDSRAVPNVTNSNYLKTLGDSLHENIDIMWSGSRVISKLITEESIEMLTKVIKRPPVIWENLHANDYDKKRVYLGPFSGRSTKIIPKLRGVLTNPNCEYEANYIAIHTLASWAKCTEDINLHNQCDPNHRLAPIEPSKACNPAVYWPERALSKALEDWLPHFLTVRALPTGMNLTTNLRQRSDVMASEQLAKEEGQETGCVDVEGSNIEMTAEENRSSSTSINKSDMDTSGSPAPVNLIDTNSCESCEMQVVAEQTSFDATSNSQKCEPQIDCAMCSAPNQERIIDNSGNYLNLDHLPLLIDLFYLPFQHGSYGYSLLRDIQWLRDNSDILINNRNSQDNITTERQDKIESEMIDSGSQDTEMNDKTVKFWMTRADKLNDMCECISRQVDTLIFHCPNKLLIFELYPYLSDLREATSMITNYIKFLRYRKSKQDHFFLSNVYRQKEAPSDEQEPWAHRGGLIGDVQRLII